MEYNYAIDKGIPVLVFALDDSVELDDEKVEKDDIKRGKLAEFKSRAMGNRLASIWRDQSDLMGKVAISIMQAKNEIKRPGWHRGNDEEKERLQKEIEYLRKENEELKKYTVGVSADTQKQKMEQDFYGKEIVLHFTEKVLVFTSNTTVNKKIVKTTLDEIFKFVSLRITGVKKVSEFRDAVSSYQPGYFVDEQDALRVRNKFEQSGLIESYLGKDDIEMIRLTDLGRDIMNELN